MHKITLIFGMLFISFALMSQTAQELEKSGNEAYKADNFKKALLDYSRAIEAYKAESITDTALYYNATIAGYKAKEWEAIIPLAQKAIDLEHEKSHLCYYLKITAYEKLDKSEDFMATLIKGHEAFPNYSKISKKLAIEYLKQGTDPFNEGAQITKNAEQYRESDTDKYMEEQEKAKVKFQEAMVIFEKAYEANAKEKQVLELLQSVYNSLELSKKAEKINAEIKAL